MFEADSTSFLRRSITATPGCAPETLSESAAVPPAIAPMSRSIFRMAREKGDLQQVIAAGKEALRADPENPLLYLDLGKAYLAAGKKHLALHAFRKGLKYGHHRGLVSEIRRLGFRRSPIFPFLGRKHPLNKFAGRFLCWLGWR